MIEIVGFIGVIGSGKDYQAKLLVNGNPGKWVQVDMKDELIDVCEDLLGFGIRDNYEDFKKCIAGTTQGGKNKGLTTTQQQIEDYPNIMTGRRLLQRMGTDVMRKRDPDYWVKAWTKKAWELAKEGFNVAVADVRFENEMMAITGMARPERLTSRIVFCDYKSDRYDATSTHLSEALAQKFLKDGFKDGQEICLKSYRG